MKSKMLCILLSVICLFAVAAPCVSASAEDERELLGRAVESAAGGESYTVMVSLASVLLNRLESKSYPGSLAAVISDAGIDISGVTPSSRAYRAAADALDGFDPTAGALGYSESTESDAPILFGTDGWCFY